MFLSSVTRKPLGGWQPWTVPDGSTGFLAGLPLGAALELVWWPLTSILCPSGCPLKQLLSLLPHCWQVACSPGGRGVTASLPGTGKVLPPVFGPVTAAGFGPGEVVVGAGQCPASPGRGVFCPLRPGGFGWLLCSSQSVGWAPLDPWGRHIVPRGDQKQGFTVQLGVCVNNTGHMEERI